MKNKKEKTEALLWQKVNNHKRLWLAVVIFAVASVFSWWFFVGFASASWKNSVLYKIDSFQKSITTGAAAAMTEEEAET